MSAQLLSSKTVIQEEAPTSKTITGVGTAIVACLGLTPKGPVGVATLLTSYDQFVKIFGADFAGGIAASAVRGFFSGGGERMYFTRVVHYSDITLPNSKTSAPGTLNLLNSNVAAAPAQVTGVNTGPFALTSGDTLVIDRDGAGQSTATFTATAGQITNSATEPHNLVNNQTLQVKVNGGPTQTIVFTSGQFSDIANATDVEVRAAIAAILTNCTVTVQSGTIRITSNRKGTSSAVEIVAGTARAELGFAVSVDTGTGNVADLSAVTPAEIKTIVEAAVSDVTVANVGGLIRMVATTAGPTGKIQVMSPSTADDELGLDNTLHNGTSAGGGTATLQVDSKYDGAYANDLSILIGQPTSGLVNATTDFNLYVLYKGVVVETFPNATMLDTADRHIEKLVNDVASGSRWITVTDLQTNPGPSGVTAERPINSPGAPPVAFGPLSGGNDGLSGLAEIDFVGDPSSRLGFNSFDLIHDPDTLICPEMATPAVHSAGLTYCSVTRKGQMFFIMDPPQGLTAEAMNTYVVTTAALKNTTEDGAIYWPRVKVLNPNPAIFGPASTILIPPSGHIAGMFARNDGAKLGGIYEPPGGVERGQLPGVLGLETNEVLDERVRDLIAPNLINPITQLRGQPIAVDDVQTLLAGGNFPTIAERRGVTFIERSIEDGTQWARLRNNDDTLRGALFRTCDAFLLIQMRLGAFRSRNPDTAFFVDTGTGINPVSEQFAGRVNTRIGLATQKPARFLIFSFSQDTRALDEELAAG